VIDLHTHSTVSDGTDTPRDLVELAARVPLTALAITDHDTLDHVPEATAAASHHRLRLIPACELSCDVRTERNTAGRSPLEWERREPWDVRTERNTAGRSPLEGERTDSVAAGRSPLERNSAGRSPLERERREPWDIPPAIPGAMHLLVYFPDPDGPIAPRLRELQAARKERNTEIVARLRDAGIDISIDEVLEEAGTGAIGRPHVAAVLVRKGVVDTIDEAFERWLAKGRPAYVERKRLGPEEAIDLAHASGAVTSLAHPGSLALDDVALEHFVSRLAAAGLDGLECEYARYSPEQRAVYRAVAARHHLVATGGSDYHGAYKPDLSVGVGRGDLAVPDDVVAQLEARRR
jgi:predicted metal-dependent phosphoesterase TrpH